MNIVLNPGGALAPDQVVGRDALIARYWEILQTQSMALLANRRVGKTSVCRKMVSQPAIGFTGYMRDLEGLDRASDFVRALYDDVHTDLSRRKRVAHRAHALLKTILGKIELAGLKVHLEEQDWRNLLDAALGDLNETAEQDGRRFVLVWDEFTWFLDDCIRAGHAREAMKLLDRLRAARQTFPHLRFVFTGSVGLHEVISRLHELGYNNDPHNDVRKEALPFLASDDAVTLSRRLLAGFTSGPSDALAVHVAALCEGHPFFIHHVMQQMKFAGEHSVAAADAALDALLGDAQDPLELGHYVERLARYYADDLRPVVFAVLDALSGAPAGLDVNGLISGTAHARDAVVEACRRLRQDLYLDRDPAGRMTFRLRCLGRYWRQERGL